MHDRWLELIPLYVAHQLTPEQNAALEHHIARCQECQQELKEWQVIASVVKNEATTWATPLPPLSMKVRTEVQEKKDSNSNARPQPPRVTQLMEPTLIGPAEQRRRGRWPLSLVAAAITIVLFSSILVYVATRGGNEETSNPDVVGLSANDTSNTRLPATQPNDVASPTFTPFGGAVGNPPHPFTPLPTNTFLPFQVTAQPGPVISGVGGGIDETKLSATPPADYCTVSARDGQSAPIYDWPNQEIIDWLPSGDYRRTWVYSSDGWYQIGGRSGGIAGWVDGMTVYLHGNCSYLTLPSPTADWPSATPTQQCRVSATEDVFIRRYPNSEEEVVGVIRADEQWPTWVHSDNGWYQVGGQGGGIVGWVNSQEVFLVGDCDNLTLPTPTIAFEPSPVTSCMVQPTGNQPIPILREPSTEAERVEMLQPGERRSTWVYNGEDWYQIAGESNGIAGWVNKQDIELIGDCENLILPTTIPLDTCLLYSIIGGEPLNIFEAPTLESNSVISYSGPLTAIGQNESGWYQVEHSSFGIGWIKDTQVREEGNCNLPIMPTPE